MRRYIVQGRHAGSQSTTLSEHDDELEALNGMKQALSSGLHHASISDTGTNPWTVVEQRTRRPRLGDWITGLDEDGVRFTGRVVAIDFTDYQLADVFSGYRSDGAPAGGERLVTFEQFDVDAVPGIHYQPDDLRQGAR